MIDKKKFKIDLGGLADLESAEAQIPPSIEEVGSLRGLGLSETLAKLEQMTYARRPHVKFVRRIAPIQEAVFFAGGEESANQVIEWVTMHGGIAEHVVHDSGLFREFIRIVDTDIAGDTVRSAVRPNYWVIRESDGVYSRVMPNHFENEYQKLATNEEDSDV